MESWSIQVIAGQRKCASYVTETSTLANRLRILAESRIRWKVYVRFGGEHIETYCSNIVRRWVLSLHHVILFPIVTIIIMEVFISKMRKLEGIRKVILIEEAWKAIAKEGMAEYIRYAFKTVRKFFGEAIVVTQEVEDIISSPIVKQAIINNSDCKILLDQSKYQNKFDQIQELLGLTEKEKSLVLSVNKANDPTKRYKEVFISLAGTLSRVYRTEVSLEEYYCYTTEQNEKMKVNEYARKYGSIQEGILELACQMRANQKHR
jgi:conjugation system TraG family ATPase